MTGWCPLSQQKSVFDTISSKRKQSEMNDDGDHWTCNCGQRVEVTKSRCGSCKHWRGGQRNTAGWKLKSQSKKKIDDDDDNEEHQFDDSPSRALATALSRRTVTDSSDEGGIGKKRKARKRPRSELDDDANVGIVSEALISHK